ncbi:cupin domain-containing protein [Methylocella tundrae]|uniref:Putative Cupin domain-containing protein n=1 Tax=Methylocella tundrae TaxID=227605 RepID=A0A4V6IN87_METTU|nr:cupin domain-containing protein [Methylocella tundrae]WPP02983.1 cupin domain-containing protein [Methylocella tundrae]VFU16699.1 putative Cupin domain-containing protein [Methylocella tundrae]
MTTLRRAAALVALLLLGSIPAARSDDAKFKGAVLDQQALGSLSGEYAMKMTLLEMDPGAAIPEHTHKGPGMRYVLEGAIAIAWKNGKTEIFKAGSTYFEAPGSSHPMGQMSARNVADGKTRVLIFEILPKQ